MTTGDGGGSGLGVDVDGSGPSNQGSRWYLSGYLVVTLMVPARVVQQCDSRPLRFFPRVPGNTHPKISGRGSG